ncbi:hypothetical protein [Ochrobactrum sp. Marseille-Q0166]|uniref:hypothetical protein n=1 Tax=Ochrobactrum sp. Marseille-Q0166 TaxID=2761105 RepID=UPI00165646FC|nr:hypothetical protein [Ochrobactrum sp. Marseille-Q0166]MBC8719286.1 hypothetical protein [Ochrobactrum sp. Marseille-Q0166]
MEKLKYWAIGIASTWALLAFVAWHYESTCGMFLSGACFSAYFEGARWILLLKWVEPYQTLIGGSLALGAGVFVLVSAREQVRASEQTENKRRKQAAIISCANVSSEFYDLISDLNKHQNHTRRTYGVNYNSTTKMFNLKATSSAQLSVINVDLSKKAYYYYRASQTLLVNSSYSLLDYSKAKAHCLVWAYLLRYISQNLSDDATFQIDQSHPIPLKELKEEAIRSGILLRLVLRDYPFIEQKTDST